MGFWKLRRLMLTENHFGEAQGFLLAFCHDLKRDVHAIDHPLPENWRGYLVPKLKSSPPWLFGQRRNGAHQERIPPSNFQQRNGLDPFLGQCED